MLSFLWWQQLQSGRYKRGRGDIAELCISGMAGFFFVCLFFYTFGSICIDFKGAKMKRRQRSKKNLNMNICALTVIDPTAMNIAVHASVHPFF